MNEILEELENNIDVENKLLTEHHNEHNDWFEIDSNLPNDLYFDDNSYPNDLS